MGPTQLEGVLLPLRSWKQTQTHWQDNGQDACPWTNEQTVLRWVGKASVPGFPLKKAANPTGGRTFCAFPGPRVNCWLSLYFRARKGKAQGLQNRTKYLQSVAGQDITGRLALTLCGLVAASLGTTHSVWGCLCTCPFKKF